MPELPEVETIVTGLDKKIKNRKIVNVWTDWPKYFKLPKSESEFKKIVIGKKILNVERRAKNILINLADGNLLLIHQKISGHLLVGKWRLFKGKWESEIPGPLSTDRNNQYLRLIFFLDNGLMLALSDLRRFAKVLAGPKEVILNLPDLKKLGPEPLAKDFTFKKFEQLFKNKKGYLKKILMDQNFISGIGNIYADEILLFAKIHPLTRAENLKTKHLKAIYKAMRFILKKAIRLKGASVDDYRDVEGKRGFYDKVRYVYQRENEPCWRCKTKIKRLKLNGRSAHFCPQCQKLI